MSARIRTHTHRVWERDQFMAGQHTKTTHPLAFALTATTSLEFPVHLTVQYVLVFGLEVEETGENPPSAQGGLHTERPQALFSELKRRLSQEPR